MRLERLQSEATVVSVMVDVVSADAPWETVTIVLRDVSGEHYAWVGSSAEAAVEKLDLRDGDKVVVEAWAAPEENENDGYRHLRRVRMWKGGISYLGAAAEGRLEEAERFDRVGEV